MENKYATETTKQKIKHTRKTIFGIQMIFVFRDKNYSRQQMAKINSILLLLKYIKHICQFLVEFSSEILSSYIV